MLPEDQLRLISCLLVAIPLSYLISTINHAPKLLATTIFASITFHAYLFGYEALALWFQQTLVYAICKFGPRKIVGKIVFV